MAARYFPHDSSALVIRRVATGVHIVSLPFAKNGLKKIGARCTIVEMTNKALAVFSPVAFDTVLAEFIKSIGDNVCYIIALSNEHHTFMGEWTKAFPNATVIGVDGLEAKRREISPIDLPGDPVEFDIVFTARNKQRLQIDETFDTNFYYEYVDSHINRELVFLFRSERVLIEADLIMNLPASEQYSKSDENPLTGFATKSIIALGSTKGTAIHQRRHLWHSMVTDRASFSESIKKIDKWDFEMIIPGHGDIIELDGKALFRKIMEWHL